MSRPFTRSYRVAVVCSARSSSTKNDGTTNRLLNAYKYCLSPEFDRSKNLVQSIRRDHLTAAHDYIKNPNLVSILVDKIELECDQLLQLLLATRTIGHGTFYIRDKVISVGERLACLFLSTTLRDRDIPSELVDFSDIVPPSMDSTINLGFFESVPAIMAKRLNSCKRVVPVVTGFFGPIERGLLAQVGRGYTDFCASMIAMGLSAQELQIWKEVEGIFTADPSKVPTARMLPEISSAEASELTFHGSEVIHYTAMRLAMRARIPIRIKNVLNPQAMGTLVRDDWKSGNPSPMRLLTSTPWGSLATPPDSPPCVGGAPTPVAITSKDNILLMNIRSTERLKAHSFFAGIFAVFDKWNLSIDLICTSEVQASMALHSEVSLVAGDDEDESELVWKDLNGAIAQLQEYGYVELLPNRTIVSLVGKQVNRAMGITGQMFSTLTENRIKIEMIAQGTLTSGPEN